LSDPFAPLIDIAGRGTPFTASDGQAFVRLNAPSSGGFYILPVRSRAYREWFFHQFYAQFATIPPSRAFHSILNLLEAEASQSEQNQRLAVFRRVGCRGNGPVPSHILLNLANPQCEFVEISPSGWKTTAGANALLQTSRSTLPLPAPAAPPAASNSLDSLRSCLNLPSRADWLRCLAWLLAALHPDGPFPVLILQGPPGSGKSFAARLLRSLIDPCSAPLNPIPSSARDLLTLARHNWILAFDHLSRLSPSLSDALCRLSSGLGATLRETAGPGAEPLQQSYKRPILLTVTKRWSCPADLAGRALTVSLPPLAPRTEASLLTVIHQAWPAILAALCSAIATALTRVSLIDPCPGRCPDALAWAMAASPALGCTEDEMRQAFAPAAPEPIVEAVRTFLQQRRHFAGTAARLLDLLPPLAGCRKPEGLSHQLRSCKLALADAGIDLKFSRSRKGSRIVELFDALYEKSPQNASKNLTPHPQPLEPEHLTPP